MDEVTVGLMHPGEMGAALGSALRNRGAVVLWASSGRSSETTRRAELAGLHDASVQELLHQSDAIVSVCPPHAAIEVARSITGFDGMFVDVNAVSPATTRTIAAIVENGRGPVCGRRSSGPPSPIARSGLCRCRMAYIKEPERSSAACRVSRKQSATKRLSRKFLWR